MHASRPSISASYFIALQRYAVARGLEIGTHRECINTARQLDDSADGNISCIDFIALVETLAKQAGDDAFGIHFIESLPPRPAGVYQHIVFNSRTLGEALEAISRFLGLVTDAFHIRYEEISGAGWMTFICPTQLGVCTQFIDGQLALIAVRARQMLGENCAPMRVDMMRDTPAPSAEFNRVFGTTPHFNQPENRIGFRLDVLAKPLPSANHQLFVTAVDYGKSLLGMTRQDHAFSTTVANFISTALQRGEASEARACIELGVTARTMQRNLSAEGTTFKALTEETRARLARHYLINTDLSLTAIAFLLGYSELSAFSRAAKTWLGETPSMLRKRHRTSGA